MSRLSWALTLLLAAFLQWGILRCVQVWGVSPQVFPPLLCLLGMTLGGEKGTLCGLLCGSFLYLAGGSPVFLAVFPLLGGLSGECFHHSGTFCGYWLRILPLLAGMELLLVLFHRLTGGSFPAAFAIAGAEFVLSALCFPAVWLLARLTGCLKRRTPCV